MENTPYERTVMSTYSAPMSSGYQHFAASILSCGHRGNCEIKPTVYACGGCGHEQANAAICEHGCGYSGFECKFVANPKRVEDRLTQVGDTQACATCEQHDKDAQRLRDLTEPVFLARYSKRWAGQYHLYRRDETSPTGVMHVMTVARTPEIDKILREKSISPLSPTEGRAG